MALLMFTGCAATPTTDTNEQTISGDSGSGVQAEVVEVADAGAAGETTVGETVAAAEASTAKAKPKIICTRERVTGSHRMTKVCRNADEIAQRREQDRRLIGDALSTPGAGPQG